MEMTRREFAKDSLTAFGFLTHPALSRFALASLGGYAGKKLTIAVRPVSSLGTKGKAIGTTFRV
ncbi:MAG: hypothetical protein K6G91_07790 [Kiritimatiellae bacterium]|nr:hypothetical protein [Kiritimatiellia bacterium]